MSDRYYPDPDREERHLRITAIALVLFFSGLVTIAALIFINAQHIARALPFEAEKRFVRPYEQIIDYFNRDQEPPLRHAEIKAYLTDLSNTISTEMALPDDHALSIHYLDSEMINAFAMLGGHVFVTRGMLDALETENSLSMVMAHEIAHVKHRDPLAGMGRGLALQLILSFVTGQSGSGSTIAASGGELGLLHFSREQESAADIAAMQTLYGIYGHVDDAGDLFELLIEARSTEELDDDYIEQLSDVEDTLEGWLSTHPELAERLDAMNKISEQKGWPTQGDLTPLPVWLKEAVKPRVIPEPEAFKD